MKKRLTDRTLQALKPAGYRRQYDVWDQTTPGFGVRVGESGRKSFILVARFPEATHSTRRVIGEYPALSLAEAREEANRWRRMIKRGEDPREEQRQRELADQRRRENSFASVCEAYIEEIHYRKLRSAEEVERCMRREFIGRWGTRPIVEIKRAHVLRVLDETKNRGNASMAHHLLAYLRGFFNWAIERDAYGLETSPCDRLRPERIIGKTKSRTRVLSDDELRALWRATERMGYPWGSFYRLLLLTGVRLREGSEARWREFDLERKVWAIPPERFKSDSTHVVPLSDDVVALLSELPRFKGGQFVFSSTHGAKPINHFSQLKDNLDRRMHLTLRAMARDRKLELEHFTNHDIRRTVRTRLSSLRVSDTVAELVLGHARKGLQRVYDQHRYLDEMREALDLWARHLRDITTPAPANVVKLRTAR